MKPWAVEAMNSRLFEKIYGWLIGASVGDAMGAAVENMHYLDIREQFGWVEGFLDYPPRYQGGRPDYEVYSLFWHERREVQRTEPHPWGAWRLEAGVYTDDMRWRILGIRSFLKRGRRVSGWDFARDALAYRIDCARFPEGDPQRVWSEGLFNLDELVQMCLKSPFGHTQIVGGVWGSPAGIIDAADPQRGAEDGGVIGAVVAEAMRPGASVDSVIKTAFDYAAYLPDPEREPLPTWAGAFRTRLKRALEDADESGDVFELIEKLYTWLCATCPPFSIQNVFEALVAALAMVYKAEGDFRQAVIGSVNFGRDCDTIACIAGEVLGALHGISAVPKEWTETIERQNPDPPLRRLAAEAAEAVQEKNRRERQIADEVLGMS